jgi:hypothetical protein
MGFKSRGLGFITTAVYPAGTCRGCPYTGDTVYMGADGDREKL